MSDAELRKELAKFYTDELCQQQQELMQNLFLAWDKHVNKKKKKAGGVVATVAPMLQWMDKNERRERDKASRNRAAARGPKPRGKEEVAGLSAEDDDDDDDFESGDSAMERYWADLKGRYRRDVIVALAELAEAEEAMPLTAVQQHALDFAAFSPRTVVCRRVPNVVRKRQRNEDGGMRVDCVLIVC